MRCQGVRPAVPLTSVVCSNTPSSPDNGVLIRTSSRTAKAGSVRANASLDVGMCSADCVSLSPSFSSSLLLMRSAERLCRWDGPLMRQGSNELRSHTHTHSRGREHRRPSILFNRSPGHTAKTYPHTHTPKHAQTQAQNRAGEEGVASRHKSACGALPHHATAPQYS